MFIFRSTSSLLFFPLFPVFVSVQSVLYGFLCFLLYFFPCMNSHFLLLCLLTILTLNERVQIAFALEILAQASWHLIKFSASLRNFQI